MCWASILSEAGSLCSGNNQDSVGITAIHRLNFKCRLRAGSAKWAVVHNA